MSPVRPKRFVSLAAGLVLAASLPVAAQQGDMSSRMLLELQQMREEVRELRGLVEEQAREIENLKRRQRDQYVDLDRRISGLGSAGTAGTGSNGGTDAPDAGPSPIDASQPALGRLSDGGPGGEDRPERGGAIDARPAQDLPEVRAPIDETPQVTTLADPGDTGTRELQQPGEAERQAYDQAFLALRETRYADAAEGFDAFLRDHPDSTYAPNALYWLGEVYYVTRDFETALEQFERLQETYPDSSKQPDALLKVGFSHYELGQWERARAALEQVIADYPGTNYSRLAENRLRTMRLEGNL